MAGRSKRTKVKFQADKAIAKCNGIQEHLKYIDEVANGESEYINITIPILVSSTEMLKEALGKLRDGL